MEEQRLGAPLIAFKSPQSIQAEQFRTVRTNVEFAQIDRELHSIMVTSSIPAEGKSTISANLATVLGQTDKRILIVDADLRKPILHRTFRLNNENGLTSLLVDSSLAFNEIIQYSSDLNLYLLPSGPIPPNPAELLGSARMNQLMQDFAKHFDIVIYDVPPLTAVTDAQIMATRVDGVIIVARYGYVRKDELKIAKKLLDNVGANILGCIMNSQPMNDNGYGYGYGENYTTGG